MILDWHFPLLPQGSCDSSRLVNIERRLHHETKKVKSKKVAGLELHLEYLWAKLESQGRTLNLNLEHLVANLEHLEANLEFDGKTWNQER